MEITLSPDVCLDSRGQYVRDRYVDTSCYHSQLSCMMVIYITTDFYQLCV